MKKFKIQYEAKFCKACGICIGLCPKKVYTTDYWAKPW
jgi:2-oxoglutarate ferredoxin oxidoreductase subunit delta